MSKEEPLVPPATYHYIRSGWWGSARIVTAPPDESPSNRNQETSPLISDVSEPACNPFTTLCERLGCYFGITDVSDPPSDSPTHWIQRKGVKTFTLVEGPGDRPESRDGEGTIDFEIEGKLTWAKKILVVWDDIDLYQDKGTFPAGAVVEGQRPKSVVEHRTLDDFDNVRYSCHTAFCTGDITLTRLLDNTVIARFIRARFKFTWGLIAMLQILEPVPEELLDLIFCAIYAKYLLDEERRRSSSHK
ncbi:hypothetical protein FRC01_008693 [Tulasnella sp. 417]|nr:hypothetical protein FRC01_008693 [Tulasnella sp. 417]